MTEQDMIEEIARGEGAEYMIEQQWLDPAVLTGELARLANNAVTAFDEWKKAARELGEAAEDALGNEEYS
jgi:hypothetical protein